jgi:NADH:ubiquinone oxidoreductase subunit C
MTEDHSATEDIRLPSIVEKLKSRFPGYFLDFYETKDHPCVEISPDSLIEVCRYLKEELGFNYLRSLTSDDLIGDNLFEILYFFVQIPGGEKLQLKAKVDRDNPKIDSLYNIWRSSDLQEREVYDMYGVRFEGHPDLRRLLMHESFPGHPLRKDYPVGGTEDDLYAVKGYWAEGYFSPEQEEYREARRGKK